MHEKCFCLLLAETLPSKTLLSDPFETQQFFNHHFKDSKKVVFKKDIEYHQPNEEELKEYYKSISKISKPAIQYPKDKGTVGSLFSAFFHIAN